MEDKIECKSNLLQYDIKPKVRIPWKAIGLAAVLFLGGTLLLVLGSLLVAGRIDAKVSASLIYGITLNYEFKYSIHHLNCILTYQV
jgi:hypothetical protein